MTPDEIRDRLAGESLPADLSKALDDLLDEIERLRAALQLIADHRINDQVATMTAADNLILLARKALEGSDE